MAKKTGLELIRFIRDENRRLQGKASFVNFRYYVGIDETGKPQTFRFMRGGDLKMWQKATAKFTRVYGPFNTLTAAAIF